MSRLFTRVARHRKPLRHGRRRDAAWPSPASAETYSLIASLNGTSEVPSNSTAGTGSLTATYDTTTKKLAWTVTYSGLTGAAVAAHFHGPAAPGKDAPVEVPLKRRSQPIAGLGRPDASAGKRPARRQYLYQHPYPGQSEG